MSARTSYRTLLAITGPGFPVLTFLARLPASMAPLGLITLMVAETGSFAQAGLVTAALGVGAAAGGPVLGTLSDRFGQRRLGATAAVINAAALLLSVWAVHAGMGLALIAALAAAAGFATPQVGPLVRVRWAALLRPATSTSSVSLVTAGERGGVSRPPSASLTTAGMSSRASTEVSSRASATPSASLTAATPSASLTTAMAYEGAVDEASYVAGPALVGVLALTGVTALPLLVAGALALAAAVPFALHPTAALVPRRHRTAAADVGRSDAVSRRRPVAALGVLIVTMVSIGVIFGATQTGITALAASVGHESSAGLIYAVLGVGSALAGLATAWVPARFPLRRRLPVFAAVLLVGVLPLLLVKSIPTAAIAIVLVGVAVAPLLVTAYALAERIAPSGRGGMVMTLLASGTVAGVALGAGIAGQLVGPYGYPGAFVVPLVAASIAVIASIAGGSRLRTALTLAESAPRPPVSTGVRWQDALLRDQGRTAVSVSHETAVRPKIR